EISPEGVLAAAQQGEAPAYAFVELPAGAVAPGIGEANLQAPEAVAEAIRSALEQVSPRTRSVTLVLPDPAVRVFVLDFDSFPAKAAEAVPVVRFRLRKTVPFDAEQAGIGYQVLTTTIVTENDLLLYRTLDLPADAAGRATEVQRGIAVAAAYYEDKVGTRPDELHYSGRENRMEFARWVGNPELRVVDLVERPMGLPMGRASAAGVVGALAGVR